MRTIKINYNEIIPNNFTGIVEYQSGDKLWYKEGKIHRENGPAWEFPDGEKHWYKEDKLHRLDGPACEYPDGIKYWYIENKFYYPNKLSELINSSVYLGKEKGQYNFEWLKFLTENGIEEFPIMPGMKEYVDFEKVFRILETKLVKH
jgi:hypothetical protein